MIVFSGEHEHSVDSAGRVIIPVSFRDVLLDGVFLARGKDGCIWLFPKKTWEMLSSRLRQGRSFTRASIARDRRLFSGSEMPVDKQGRLMLPSHLRSHAGLEDGGPVVIVGVKNRLELWHPDRWHRLLSEDDGEAFEEAMEELDL